MSTTNITVPIQREPELLGRTDYPIMIDTDHDIWRGFNNEY